MAVAAREEREEKMKWLIAVGGVAFVGFAVWQYLTEAVPGEGGESCKRGAVGGGVRRSGL